MNLGGASNVDLTEAARLLKQSAVAGAPNQQVPPPMMLMQQAVAMQQFQFQQALLMQQVMATQQAAARAATVKSAQEMAAARAAEISKQLKGNEPEVEGQEKKSPGRSLSRTPSRSRSRSISRSKSRSPLRYRRDRSTSRSPIRYRRDPVSREYFGHRGRSRRGYYRGRGEYAAWNPSYRRERDHYSSRSRRSRSRSRSRGRSRRSHSRSRSPRRPRRDRSGTPLRYRSSRRSRSVGGRPTPSRSRSRSRSESLHPERDGKVRSDTKEETRPKSISPARSLSVSLSPPPRKNVEGALKPNDWKKAMMREALVQRITESNGGEGSPEQEIDTKGAFRSKGGDFVAKREEFSSDESDGNKDVDDWRDDIKVNELEKMKRKESKREMERREEERRAQVPVHVVVPEEAKGHVMTLLEHLGRGTGKLSVESPFTAFKVPVEPEAGVNGGMGLSVQEEIILDRVSTGNDEEAGDVTHGSADEESDVVFEGPLPPEEEEVGKRSPDSSKGEESGEEIGVEEPPSVAEQEVKGKGKSKRRGDEGARGLRAGKDRSKLKEDDEHRKSKAKSRSRERSRSKRHEDETDHERRKDKHRRHRRRRRRDEESEKEEDDEDETGDADSSKEREERRRRRSRRHRKEDKREKKRRRHKHRRGKSPSESPEKELLVLEAEGEGVHKKQSSGRESRRKEASKSPAHASESGSD